MNFKKTICAVLSVSIIAASFFGCGKKAENDSGKNEVTETKVQTVTYSEKANKVKKSETVYVNADNYGKEQDITVSDWIHTDKGKVMVEDESDLTDIINAKGNEVPIIKGQKVTWHMPTTDLYYRGKSKNTLPASISIKYSLDGKEISADKLAGKSGKVKIDIDIKNNISREQIVDGKKIKIYNPILVMGGFILPEDKFSAISCTNGKSIGDGSKEIAVFASAPGMKESLGLDKVKLDSKLLNLPTHFTVEADAKDFTLSNMYFAVLPLSDVGLNIDLGGSLGDIENSFTKIKSLINSVYSINPEKLISLLQENEKGINELTDSISKAAKLYEDNKDLIAVLKKYLTQENIDALKKLTDDIKDTDLQKYRELLSNPLFKTFFTDLPKIADDLESVMPIIDSLGKDLEDKNVKKSLDKLPETLKSLNSIIGTVEDNKDLIDALLDLLSSDNLDKITEIIDAVEAADIKNMISDYSALADDAENISSRFDAIIKYGNEYKIYTKASEKMETSVSFIYKIDAIEK